MKRNILTLVIILLAMVSMSSCCSLGGLGNGYGYGRGYSYGPSETGIIGTAIQNKVGSWSNNGFRISVTKATATKGLYYVVSNNGESDLYYLQPVSNAMKSLPSGVNVVSYRPYWDTFYGELVWRFYTTGRCRVIEVGNKGKYAVVE